jgi:preprotein translocase subunit SecE
MWDEPPSLVAMIAVVAIVVIVVILIFAAIGYGFGRLVL